MEGINGLPQSPLKMVVDKQNAKTGGSGFADTLKTFVQSVNREITTADNKVQLFASGKPMDIHEVVIATEKADISLKFLMQIRNKLLEGYQEIMRMSF